MCIPLCLFQPNNLKFKKAISVHRHPPAPNRRIIGELGDSLSATENIQFTQIKDWGAWFQNHRKCCFHKNKRQKSPFSVQKLTIDRDRTNWHPRKRFPIHEYTRILESIYQKGYFSHSKSVYKLEISRNMVIKEIYLRCTMP